jgi:hypothetical protein
VQTTVLIAPTAPTRFATIFLDEDGVRHRLREQYDVISAALDRVEGHEEWSVKVITRARAAEAEPVAVASGADYLRRKREEHEARATSDRDAHLVAERVHEALLDVVAASRRLPPQDPRLAGHEGTMVHNAAYLVQRGRSDDFLARVRDQGAAHPEVVVDARGPWPPYSFAMLEAT